MIRRPPRTTPLYSSAASDVYKRQDNDLAGQKTVETIAMLFTGKVNNEAYRYDGYKDLNDYLRGKRR